MKKITTICAALSLSFFSVLLGVFSVLGMYQFGKYSEYEGQLQYLEQNHEIVLKTDDGRADIDLSFQFDDEDELIVDDFPKVRVTGYYIKALNLLQVEEIGEPIDLVL